MLLRFAGGETALADIVLGSDSRELVIYDLDSKTILHREPTKGSVQRVATYQENK